MIEEKEIRDWWNALAPEQRVERAKELHLWHEGDNWSVAWEKLTGSAQRQKLFAALSNALPHDWKNKNP